MDIEIKRALAEIVGSGNFTDDLIDLISYSSDASEERHRPEAAVWPRTTADVSAILKLANEKRLPVIPRGAGTGLSGMAVPIKGGLILDLIRMNRIVKISLEDRLAVVQPGVVYADLQKALEPYGYFFPPDPASGSVATLGGNVATNAGGMKGAKYGTTRDYVLGLEVVLADGSVLRAGSSCMKCVSGYELARIFIGSEGTLGVITEITLKINPKPLAVATGTACFDDLAQAGRSVSAIMRSGIIPSVLEFLDQETLRAINRTAGLGLEETAAMILAETDGFTPAEADFQMDRLVETLKANGAAAVTRAGSPREAERFWKARRSVFNALSSLDRNLLVEDVTVPLSRITDMLLGLKEIGRRRHLRLAILGHLGDGNFHPNIMYDGSDPDQAGRAELAVEDIFKLSIELGGTLTGEHGIGLTKARFMPLEHGPTALRVMNALKRTLDPNGILNPGKMGLEL
ncbi:MAG: FAD-linked oxidase C-terminal domain-containing protein [Thermodesulfobacteriota bacterium]